MKTGILLALSLFVSFANAKEPDDNLAKRFRGAAIQAIEEAQGRGLQHVNGYRLEDIKQAAKKAIIVHYPNIQLTTGNRKCAYWTNAGNNLARDLETGEMVRVAPSIYLNKGCAELSAEEMKGIAVHEVMGVTYGADLNYEVSSQILSGVEFSEKIDVDPAGGGVTGVGGGGDIDDLNFKVIGLREIERIGNYKGFSTAELKKAFLKMKVSAAGDIPGQLEFRGQGVEMYGPVLYVHTSIYRGKETALKASLALEGAVLYLLFAEYRTIERR